MQHLTVRSRLLIATLVTTLSPSVALASGLLSGDQPQTMQIDLLPGNPENVINLGTQRIVEVAILGSETLNVTDVNPRTLSLEATEINLVGKSDKSRCRVEDINADGFDDLVCDFKTIGYRVEPGDIPVVISGGTYQRLSLRAEAILRYRAD